MSPGDILDPRMEEERSTAAVELDSISRRFGATQALDGVSLELYSSEIHALVGENGAGKSTLVKILAGVYQPDAGHLRLHGLPIQLQGPAHQRELGYVVSHRLEEVFALCERATVLRDGRHVVTASTRELAPGDLIRHMVGRDVSLFPKAETTAGDVLLKVRNLTRSGAFRDISFEVRAGEIVGMAGLVGAGRTEVPRVMFGIDRADGGRVRLGGREVSFATPADALRAGVAYVPEDRHQEGLVLEFPIASTVTLPILARLFPRFFVDRTAERRLAQEYATQLRVLLTQVVQLVCAVSD